MANPNLLGISTVKARVLASLQLASGDNTIYTAGASTAAKLATLTLCNTSGSAVTVSVSLVPPSGTVDGTHKVVSGYSLAAGDTVTISEIAGAFVEATAFVSVNASAGSAVDAVLTGVELS